MRLNDRTKVALIAATCLVAQGYLFEYVLLVEPVVLVSLAPLLLYVAYLVSRGRISSSYDRPAYWIVSLILLTLADLGSYAL